MPRLALTREVSPRIADGELTFLEPKPVDFDRARAEHDAYEAALRQLGYRVERLGADPRMADSVFIEDTAVVLDELAVITRPGAESRRAETAGVATVLRSLRPIASILAPGTLDGGDVLMIGRTLFVGQADGTQGRTNASGLRQLAAFVGSQGYTVQPMPFNGCLHLKTAATQVAEDLLLVNPAWVDPAAFPGMRALEVDPAEPFGANALWTENAVMYPAEFERTRQRLERAGVRVTPVAAGELAKVEGGVTCCSLLLR
jgi:dimethylargininase